MTHVPNIVVIPTATNKPCCQELTTELLVQNECDLIVVIDNSDEQDLKDYLMIDRKLLVDRQPPGTNIYHMWNSGWQIATGYAWGKRDGVPRTDPEVPFNLAVLNDDIHIPDAFISRLAYALRESTLEPTVVYPDYTICVNADGGGEPGAPIPTKGSYKAGGMCGFAFMFRGEEWVNDPFDEQFEWWCGDDDFIRRIESLGGIIARVPDVGIDHDSEGSAMHRPDLQEAKGRDIERMKAKWGSW